MGASPRDLLVALKAAAGRPGPQLQLVPDAGLRLRPVATGLEAQSEDDVRCLTEWRNRYVTAFLTEFVATEAQTASWLANVVGPSDDRILFMIDDDSGTTVGYMGIAFIDWDRSYAEADAIVRGRELPKGAMGRALKSLIAWAKGQLRMATIGVRVRSDNPALEFYRRIGFVEHRRVPLSRRHESNMTVWYENPEDVSSSVWLVHHRLGD